MDELTGDELTNHLDGIPDVNDFMEAAEADITYNGQLPLEQGVAYVRDVAKKMCKNIDYGDEAWNEVWAAATVVLFNMLTALSSVSEDLTAQKIDGLCMEFFLLGSRGKVEDLESMLNTPG